MCTGEGGNSVAYGSFKLVFVNAQLDTSRKNP